MKNILFFLLTIFLFQTSAFGAIPIDNTETSQHTTVRQKKPTRLTSVVKKYQLRLAKQLNKPHAETTDRQALFNWLAFGCGILTIGTMMAGLFLPAIVLSIASVILGIVGLSRRERLRGLGIAGMALGGGFIILVILAIFLLFALFFED